MSRLYLCTKTTLASLKENKEQDYRRILIDRNKTKYATGNNRPIILLVDILDP